MNISSAARHFTAFSGKPADDCGAFLGQAERELSSRLKPTANADDERLNVLWGAAAAYRLTVAECARESLRVTPAGSVSAEGNSLKRIEAAGFLRDAENACAELLSDEDFIFAGVRG